MAITLLNAATRLNANAATVATAMASGTTANEVKGIADLLKTVSYRNDLYQQIAHLSTSKELKP